MFTVEMYVSAKFLNDCLEFDNYCFAMKRLVQKKTKDVFEKEFASSEIIKL